MKVLHFYKSSFPDTYGGVEKFIDTLCRESNKLGVENKVLSLSKSPSKNPIQMNGYEVIQVKEDLFVASTGFSISAIKKFKQLANEADIVHYHFPNPFADILHFICNIKKPTIVTYHSDILKQKILLQIYKPLRDSFLKSVDCIVATSPNYFVTSTVLQKFHNKTSVIPIGIDLDDYPKINDSIAKTFKEKLKMPFFLFVGALRYYKGLHIAIEAAVIDQDINIVLAGVGGIKEELEKQVKSLQLKNVKFLGSIDEDEKVVLLSQCYGFIFPSHLRTEAFGISLLEASAFGKPMISCEIGSGTSFVNKHNETGIIINPGSSKELYDAMKFLLDNEDIAKEMGRRAKIRAKELFSSMEQAKSYYKTYYTLLSHNKGNI